MSEQREKSRFSMLVEFLDWMFLGAILSMLLGKFLGWAPIW